MSGRWAARNALHPREGRLVALERAGRRGHPPPAHVLADLRARVPVRGKAVERGLVHPDPDREAVGVEPRRIPARREPADLLLGDRSGRAAPSGSRRSFVQASAATMTRPAVSRSPSSRITIVSPAESSIRATGACSRSTAPCSTARRRWATLPRDGSASPPSAWNRPSVPVVEPPGRPAARDLGPVQLLERDALGGHRPRVLADVDGDARGRLARPHVEAAGAEHDLRAALALDLGPRLVRPGGEPHVVAAVVGAPDDPAHVLRCAVVVPDLVPLEAPGPASRFAARPSRPRRTRAPRAPRRRRPSRGVTRGLRDRPAARCRPRRPRGRGARRRSAGCRG